MNADVLADPKARVARAWSVLATVMDPELPVVSLPDLGIVREVAAHGDGVEVVLTPTYSGCPATETIEREVVQALEAEGLGPVTARWQRAPAWTTDWISETGRQRLREGGIAPPLPAGVQPLRFVPRSLECPHCGSRDTERLSAFGSTACKALHRCRACGEPFEHFKAI